MKTLERLGQVRSDLSSIFISILGMNQNHGLILLHMVEF